MKIIKILLLSIILLIFLIYRNKIEGIDIIDPSHTSDTILVSDFRPGFVDLSAFQNIENEKITNKKILIKINRSNLSFLSESENSSLINKEIIATMKGNSDYVCTTYSDLGSPVYSMCTYKIIDIENKNNNILPNLFDKLHYFFFFESLYDYTALQNPAIQSTNLYPKIPSKSFNDLITGFADVPEETDWVNNVPSAEQIQEQSIQNSLPDADTNPYNYYRSNEQSKLNIVRENDDTDFIELEIINYLTDTGEEIKITKEKIKKYIYSQFLQ